METIDDRLIDPSSWLAGAIATVGEVAAGAGIILLVVCMLSVLATVVLRPRRIRWLRRLAGWSAAVGVAGIALWLGTFFLLRV